MKPFFAFSGQGAQAVGMGKDLYDKYPAAKAVFDEADAALGYKISEICFEGPAEKLTETIYCQPAIYTMSVACLEAFRSRFGESVVPTACAGLSLGEYGALYAAGTFNFAEGLKL
ncbi:MAG: ACP S-malonyltransferase, partial [Lentisphaeria bacterium]|nr:ACP S-malonyltransferase [Lentisphaeria bacterium]